MFLLLCLLHNISSVHIYCCRITGALVTVSITYYFRCTHKLLSNTGVRIEEVFCEGGKIVLFIFPAVGRLFNMAGFTLYDVPLN